MAAGCALAFRFSARLGLCDGQDAERAGAAIRSAGLPASMAEIRPAPFPAARLLEHMAQDKKAEGGKLNFILARGIGRAEVVKAVDPGAVRDFLIAEGAVP